MAEYHKVEYRISKDGTVTETVLGASGASCTHTTANLEDAIGKVESRELLPDYYQDDEYLEYLTEHVAEHQTVDGM